eukprot:CAMPEP_0113556380 /NCGR_PEP_ID=MMETSP0015_2-20120614/17226_1 /TAXON_ID=2838 /ORGANISM="Odontella" /LENGTH=170 /DNA_ID=CAMNT_0000457733 /DNA_START=194 /DNA_END=703 /DNA_ORIENTATION=- /assembly_acc=CAM_ASM_000160
MSPPARDGKQTTGSTESRKTSSLPFQSLMKDIEDCDRPACEDTVSALSAAIGRVKNNAGDKRDRRGACPPTSGELGTASWTLLHSMAAWFPDNPTAGDEKKMSSFISAFSTFYPCTYCAEDFQQNIKKSPVRTNSREGLCVWLCEQHNTVNEKLGKPLFQCDIKSLDKRW